jgi:cytochrome c oxidase subunit 2
LLTFARPDSILTAMVTFRTARRRAGFLALLLGAAGASTVGVAGQAPPRDIGVVARRFAFEPARIEVALGERVRLLVVSADGVHGIEIKQFRVNREIPRGTRPVAIEFTASQAGEFPILCSEYCGDGHSDMTGQLVVVARAEPLEGRGVRASASFRILNPWIAPGPANNPGADR